jgi:hypothetical protein
LFPSTVAIAGHCFDLSMCVVSLLLDVICRQCSTAVWISIDTEGGLILRSGPIDLIPKAVVHCGPDPNQSLNHVTVDTLDAHVKTDAVTPYFGVVQEVY